MRASFIVITALLSTACAQTPPVTTTYYLAKSSLHAKVVRTVGCDLQNHPLVASALTPIEVLHSADTSTSPETLSLHKVDGPFANSELKTDFYADGRLQAINATSVGQGETILKAAISLATVVLEDAGTRQQVEAKCKAFKTAFKDKPLSLTYEIWDNLAPTPAEVPIPANAESATYDRAYKLLLGSLCLRKGAVTHRIPAQYTGSSDAVLVTARQPANMEVAVATGPSGGCGTSNLWAGTVQVAQLGDRYTLPIPRAALFGKQVFAASFNEAGALTSLGYNKDSGAASLLSTLQAGAEAVQTTSAEQAAELKTEADVIAAQQRLIGCRTDPKNCK